MGEIVKVLYEDIIKENERLKNEIEILRQKVEGIEYAIINTTNFIEEIRRIVRNGY